MSETRNTNTMYEKISITELCYVSDSRHLRTTKSKYHKEVHARGTRENGVLYVTRQEIPCMSRRKYLKYRKVVPFHRKCLSVTK